MANTPDREPRTADVRQALAEVARPTDAAALRWFFKTEPGEYGEGDMFIGVRVPAQRRIARRFRALPHGNRTQARRQLLNLARAPSVWQRRMAMLATHAFIRAGEAEEALAVAGGCWPTRTISSTRRSGGCCASSGKRVGLEPLRLFLRAHAAHMPRTALRYAIERLPPTERARWLRRKADRLSKPHSASRWQSVQGGLKLAPSGSTAWPPTGTSGQGDERDGCPGSTARSRPAGTTSASPGSTNRVGAVELTRASPERPTKISSRSIGMRRSGCGRAQA